MLLVYSDTITPRLKYITNLLFGDVMGLGFRLTDDQKIYIDHPSGKINYSGKNFRDGILLRPSGLLSESGIKDKKITTFQWDGYPVFFRTDDDEIPFDILSLAFYLVSRYEEYTASDRDVHGRFKPASSLAHREGFLEIPLINILAGKLSSMLRKHYPGLEVQSHEYSFHPTIDIDMAYAHRAKSLMRTVGGMARLMLALDLKKLYEKIAVLSGRKKDPYDNFEYQSDIFRQYGLKPLYFVLIGDYGSFDKNSSHKNREFRRFLSELAQTSELGIHPSYHSMDDINMMETEITRLEEISGREIRESRQHFLRFILPDTFRYLLDCGIKRDYSMGYATRIGFRASICTPFRFYDLNREEELPLEMHPFAFMDTTLRDYMKLNSDDYLKFVMPLIEVTKSVRGNLTGIWHNYAMSDDEGERKAFRDIINAACHD